MDPRVRNHAEVVAEHSVNVQSGDQVVVMAPPGAEDLVVALYEACGERDANPVWMSRSSRAARARLLEADPEAFTLAEHVEALVEHADAIVQVRGSANVSETSDVPPEKMAAWGKAQQALQDAFDTEDTCITQHPATGQAQKAEMSTEAYEEFVYDAVNRDWDAQREFQAQLVDILDPAEEVRVVSGDETDVSMSVAGMDAVNDDGKVNLPGGEVFTAPVPDSVEGTVRFDKPLLWQGKEIQNAYLEFEGGEVVAHDADQHADVLAAVLDTDEGASRLGELGIGMNRGIDRFTYNMLFDEKMGDTVHLALGRAIDQTVPEGQPRNESATHVDMIVDMSEDSFIEIDGEVVQRDGTFRFEDGFEE
ncbi:MAG: aminopeptidase [Halobacterium sp.]